MVIVRYQLDQHVGYGALEGEQVQPLIGDLFAGYTRGSSTIPLDGIRLLAPCVPSKVIAVGNNYADRSREAGLPAPAFPLLALKPASSVIGPGEPIVLPPQSQRVEHGAELAVVIGRRGRWIEVEQADQYILGYTCANDVTARDILELEGLWTRAKAFDTFCPLGPAIQTQLPLADALVQCRVNGENRQMTSTHDMLFSVPQLVAFASSVMTLEPGDVLLTGTPSGVGALAPGDTVEVEIEGVGVLKNPVA
jgi:2-keto-4-pentenoate hydratase/2-oxohepta-3-ene-1,7-dioic acid hydratase in catechol pathway